ncbi:MULTISPECIES: phage tail tape measure protein [unclassified Ensifer]|uniref:phage tail tape measure protein n=1 Tax=unclassified Ensifer TaxID=2633371 RepID=UPI0008135BFB|nr:MULTISPECIES: phage tail tape measure protein [unclassified Ensifer]OCP07989.1 hypothetical protein BC362_10285 [Ensifer sp. LC14]OCP10901.1 hypothetical protein BC374_17680 [Ensifer sp. LC13]OCP11553.1 hypothetical protein BBX50_18175 [Ensifer sp. LC11]OCP33372.1 hypothetical protein BC364_17065 [Ensifer sp. LC499]
MAKAPEIKINAKVTGFDEIFARLQDLESRFKQVSAKIDASASKATDGLTTGLKNSQTAIATTASIGVKSFGAIKGAASTFVSVLQTGVSILASLGRMAVNVGGSIALLGGGAYTAMKAFSTQTASSIADMGNLAKAAGVPVERFSRLASAVRGVGGNVNDLTTGLQSLSDKVIEAGKDAEGTAAGAFEQIGVEVRDAQGNLKSTSTVIDEVADALQRVPSDTLRAGAAFDLFGTSAQKILPILRNGAKGLAEAEQRADRFGTVVTAAQAEKMEGLLVKQRSVNEALRGLAYKTVDAIFPTLTDRSEEWADAIAKNSARVSKFLGDTLVTVKQIGDDVVSAFQGKTVEIENSVVRRMAPALYTVRRISLDLIDTLNGRGASRELWLNDVGKSLSAATDGALQFGLAILGAAGYAQDDLPTIAQLAEGVRIAIESLKNGLAGNDSSDAIMPWASNIGESLRNLGIAVGAVASVIIKHKDEITAALAFITKGFSDLVQAVATLLNGGQISEENPFEFLQPIAEFVRANSDMIIATIVAIPAQIAGAFEFLKSFFVTIYGFLDSFAQMIGLDSALQLGLILLALKLTGVGALLQKLGTAFSTTLFIVNGLTGVFKNLFSLIAVSVVPAISSLATMIVGATAPIWLFAAAVAGIVAAIVAAAAAVWYWRDELWSAVTWIGGTLWSAMKGIVNALLHPVDTFYKAMDFVKSKLRSFAEWIGLFDKEIESPFDTAAEKIEEKTGSTVDRLKDKYGELKESASDTADDIRKEMSDAAVDSEKAFDSFLSTAPSAADAAVDGMKNKLSELPEAVKGNAEDLQKSLGSTFDGYASKASPAIDGMKAKLDALGQRSEELTARGKATYDELSTDGLNVDLSGAGAAVDKGMLLVKDKFGQLVPYVDGVSSETEQRTDELGKNLAKTLDQQVSNAQKLSSDGTAYVLDQYGQVVPVVGKIADEANARSRDILQGLSDQAVQSNDAIQQSLGELPGFLGEQGKLVRQSLDQQIGDVKSTSADGIAYVRDQYGQLVPYVEQQRDGMRSAAQGAFDAVGERATKVGEDVRTTWDTLPGYIDQQAKSVNSGINQLLDQADRYQTTVLGKMEAGWTRFNEFFRSSVNTFSGLFADLWGSFLETPQLAYEAVVNAWGGMDDHFASVVGNVDGYFETLWKNVKSGATEAWQKVRTMFAPGFSSASEAITGAVSQVQKFANGGTISGPGTGTSDSIWAKVSTGEGILTSRAVSHYGSGIVDMLNSLVMPKNFMATPAYAPSRSGQDLGRLSLAIDGRGVGGTVYADSDALRSIKRDFRNRASSARGAVPRWRGY